MEIRAVRHLCGKGWLLAPFFPLGIAATTVRDHLRHFLASIDATKRAADDET